MASSLLMIVFLDLSRTLKKTKLSEFTSKQLFWVSQILMPVILVIAIWFWVTESGCTTCNNGSPWLAILTLVAGGVFYLYTDRLTKHIGPRWVVAVLFTLVTAFSFLELKVNDITIASGLMALALVYIVIGYLLEKEGDQLSKGLPFYVLAYLVALYLTFTTYQTSSDVLSLIIILFGDVFLLGFTSFIRRDVRWLYGAVWLFCLPVYLLANTYITLIDNQSLVMFGLGLIYLVSGYLVGRRNLNWGGPLLTSAAFLSVVSSAMASGNLILVTIFLITWSTLYSLIAAWLKWSWLLIPGILAANLAVFTLNYEIALQNKEIIPEPMIPFFWENLIVSYSGLGIVSWFIARYLTRIIERDWTWPLYAIGFLNLAGGFVASLFMRDWIAFGITGLIAILFMVYARLKMIKIIEQSFFPILPYLGIGGIFVTQLYLANGLDLKDYWPLFSVVFCTAFAAGAWWLRKNKQGDIYQLPLLLGGLGLMVIPLVGSFVFWIPWVAVLVFLVAGVVYLIDAGLRRFQLTAYLGTGILFFTQFHALDAYWPTAWDFWPVITSGVCGVLAAIAWWLRGKKLEGVYEIPARIGGLGLLMIPLLGSVWLWIWNEDIWIAAVVFIICGLVWLVDAGLRRLQWMAFPGMGTAFIAHFFLLGAYWQGALEIWPIITIGLCTLLTAIAWWLRERDLERIYGLPLRIAGLGLMIIPLGGSITFVESWIAAVVFSICGLILLADAGIRQIRWIAFPGVVVIFSAHFFLRMALWPEGDIYWPVISAGVCLILTMISWLLRSRKIKDIYELPFRLGGLVLIIIPILGVLIQISESIYMKTYLFMPGVLTFGIAGVMYLIYAILRDKPILGYVGIANIVFMIWTLWGHFEITELQAFILPLGFALLGSGWYERKRYKGRFYLPFTIAGCVLMLGTAFFQSIPRDAWEYAVLVGIESLLAIAWGIRSHLRGYVMLGGLALILNALFQFIPSFLEWSRWMQIGLTGSILLGLGLLALFQREKLLETREKISKEWQSWDQ
jgi:hypothetical protein